MKKIRFIIAFLFLAQVSFAQEESAFDIGEWFKFRVSYSGWMKAGEATLTIKDAEIEGTPVFHIVGEGKTTGAIKWFFKVEDHYETYIDKQEFIPYRFVREIDEGGYTKNVEIKFDQTTNKAHVHDKKNNHKKTYDTGPNVQDLVSVFYYLRSKLDTDSLKVNDEVSTNMFFDEKNYGAKVKYLGVETIRTRFGKVKCLKFRPFVMAGRVFKEEESVVLWVSADKNKIPLRIKANLAIGSLRADLYEFKGLKHQFVIQY